MSGWVDQVVISTIEAESPARFQYWSALTAISAVVKKNLFLDRYYYKLYPNIYVFLVAKSGLRKGNPVTLAKKLVQEADLTRVIMGRNSIQAVLKELGKTKSLENGGMVKDAAAYLVSGELASFLVKDPEALTILTDLYDTHANEPEWKNTLKTSGTDTLKNPCLTLLGATNEDHFKAAVPNDAIGGGFIARTLIVFEQRRRVINDLMDPPKVTPSIKDLVCYLKEIGKKEGQFIIPKESKMMYREWYKQLATEQHTDRTGSVERLGDTVLKVAMLLSLSHDLSLEIRPESMDEAIKQCVGCLDGLSQVTMGQGKSESAYETSLVMKELLKRPDHKMTRKAMLAKFWGEFDSLVLDRIVQTLVEAGALEADRVNQGKDIMYTMTKKAVDMYQKFKQEIN